jgi:hypothetical protein
LQGRHFTPIFPVLVLAVVPGRKFFPWLAGWIVPLIALVASVISLAVFLLGIYLSYYVVCGTSIYSPGLCYQPQYKNWAPNDHFTQPVIQDVVLQQTFTAVCAPLRSVRVWSAPAAQGSTGETQIALIDPESGVVLKEALVRNQTSSTNGWLEITFPPLENANGKQFMIEITSGLRDPASALSFGVSTRREYLDGIIINQVPGDYDLLFQYGCNPLTLADLIHQRNP